ncbi:hypothetical protein [Arsenicicoccus piscis]|uniref:Uncharacterized protein n=1 Tax=Arsenicicoccus piscis TaxID=673954 RepID=A0ABQ6HJI2_9MICO|nr:hypothetical protein [Arsenicicoccus piscis]GMA18641.1 hypothetical protein GCM10025862_06620 [Arsenicicoccus piscis]
MTSNQLWPGRLVHDSTVPVSVVEWRRRRLLAAGFAPALAGRVTRARIDLHELLGLLDRGCPPVLAVRILAPIEPAADLPSLGDSPLSPVSPWPPNATQPPVARGTDR